MNPVDSLLKKDIHDRFDGEVRYTEVRKLKGFETGHAKLTRLLFTLISACDSKAEPTSARDSGCVRGGAPATGSGKYAAVRYSIAVITVVLYRCVGGVLEE